MINAAEKMKAEFRLMTNITCWMLEHGKVLRDVSKTNPYVSMRNLRIAWRGYEYSIMIVDGEACKIEKVRPYRPFPDDDPD